MFGESSDDANAAPPQQTYAARRRGENAVLLQQQLGGFPLRMSGIDNSYKIDGDVLLVIHASIPPGVERPTLPRGRQMPVRRRPYDPTTIAARYYHHHHYYTTQ